ncbi:MULTISPECIES: multidrug effflux MFS transporter [Pseudomonas]|uniref:multidrug effflux MFS transporter n=1 Tax=Pseudomonas TaxID=286 RepID=UPI0038210067
MSSPSCSSHATSPAVTGRMSERRVSLLCGLLATLGPVSLTIYLPSVSEVTRYFATDQAHVQLSISSFFAGFALTQLVCGPLSDRYGRKPVAIAFLLIYLAGSALALLAQSIESLIAARVLQGVGSAVGIALSRAIVRDLFVREQAVRIQAGVGIAMSAGPVLSPTLGGAIVTLGDWHLVFVVMAAWGLTVLLTVLTMLRETRPLPASSLSPAHIAGTYRRVLATPRFLLAALVLAGTNGTIYAQASVLPLVMIDQLRLAPYQFGLFMLFQALAFVGCSLLLRRWVGRVSVRRIYSIGLTLMMLSCLSLAVALLWLQPNVWLMAVPLLLCGAAVACTMPTMVVTALDAFPSSHGAASAVLGCIQMGAGMIGGYLAAQFLDPALALAMITCAMGSIALVCGVGLRRLLRPL